MKAEDESGEEQRAEGERRRLVGLGREDRQVQQYQNDGEPFDLGDGAGKSPQFLPREARIEYQAVFHGIAEKPFAPKRCEGFFVSRLRLW